MQQPELRPPAQEDSETSVLAAISMLPLLASVDDRVLSCIQSCPCSDREGQERTGIPGDTWRPSRRRHDLAGNVLPDGTRATRSGRQAVVWRAARPGEPPGPRTRRSPGGETGASGEAIARADQQGERTAGTVDVGALWVDVWDAKPAWMTTPQHRKIIDEALEQHPGDTGAGLTAALDELRSMGGGR